MKNIDDNKSNHLFSQQVISADSRELSVQSPLPSSATEEQVIKWLKENGAATLSGEASTALYTTSPTDIANWIKANFSTAKDQVEAVGDLYTNGLYQWMEANIGMPAADLQQAFGTIAWTKMNGDLGQVLNLLGQENNEIWTAVQNPTTNPYNIFSTYGEALQNLINSKWSGSSPSSSDVPPPKGLPPVNPFSQQIQSDLNAFQNAIDTLKSEIEQLKGNLSDYQKQSDSLKALIDQANSVDSSDPRYGKLQADLPLAREALSQLNTEIETAQSQLSSLEGEMATQNENLEAVKTLSEKTDPTASDATEADSLAAGVKSAQTGEAALEAVLSSIVSNDLPLVTKSLETLTNELNSATGGSSDGSDTVLTVDGTSVLVKVINGVTMYFPIARSSQGNGNYSPNEAIGYYLNAYVNAGDKTAFQAMLNGLYYLQNQSNIVRQQGGMWDHWNEEGLTGWNINIGNILAGKNPYSAQDSSYTNTASDADEDIINALIEGYRKWGNMTATDPVSSGSGAISSSKNGAGQSIIQLSDLIKVSIKSFLSGDFQANGVLSLGDFQSGKQNPFADYFDPTSFANMIDFLQANPTPPSNVNWNSVPQGGAPLSPYDAQAEIAALKNGATATWNYVEAQAAANGGWLTNNGSNTGGVSSFGYESTRALMRMGDYLLLCQETGTDPLGIEASVQQTLQTLVSNLFKDGGFQYPFNGGTINFSNANSPGGFYGGAISGPLAVALTALKQAGALPSDVSTDQVNSVLSALKFDLGNSLGGIYNPNDGGYGNAWQEGGPDGSRGYFATSLAVISEQIIDKISPQANLRNQMEATVNQENSEINDLESNLDALNTQMAGLVSDYNGASMEYQAQARDQIVDLQNQINVIQGQLAEVQTELAADQSILAEAQHTSDMDLLSGYLSTLRNNAERLHGIVAAAGLSVASAEKGAAAIDLILQSDPLIKDKKEAEARFNAAQSRVQEVAQDLSNAQTAYAQAEAAYKSAQAQVEAYSADPTKRAAALEDLEAAANNPAEAKAALDKASSDYNTLSSNLSDASTDLNDILAATSDSEVEGLMGTLTKDLDSLETQAKVVTTDLAAANTQVSDLLSHIESALKAINSADQEKYADLASAVYQRVLQEDAQLVTTANGTFTQIGDNFSSPHEAVHSESVGYKMLIDIGNGDKTAFLEDVRFMASYLDNFGLMNWNIDPATGKVVAGYNGHYAATDADQDILYAMMQGIQKWPDLASSEIVTTTIGFDSSELPPVQGSTTLMKLIQSQLSSIWKREVGHDSATGINNLMLNGDGWARDAQGNYTPSQGLNVSYFRPAYMETYQNFYDTYMAAIPEYASEKQTWYSSDPSADSVYNNMYTYILNCMKNNSQCLPPDSTLPAPGSNQYQPGGALMGGGYDAVRVAMFIAQDYAENPNGPQGEIAKAILETIVGYYVTQTKTGNSLNIPSPSTGEKMTEESAPAYAKVLWDLNGAPVVPSSELQYRNAHGDLVFSPGNPTAAACLLIACNALGAAYKPLEDTCYDYLMSNLPSDVGGGGGTDGSVKNIPYFGGMLAAISAEFLSGKFPMDSSFSRAVSSEKKRTFTVDELKNEKVNGEPQKRSLLLMTSSIDRRG